MKKEQLKKLVKEVIREIYTMKQQSSSDSLYEDYKIEVESVVIPGISTQNDMVTIITDIEYESEGGTQASGLTGPPERYDPGEGSSVSIIKVHPKLLTVTNEANQKTYETDDFDKLTPEQKVVIKKILSEYVKKNERDIESDVLDSLEG